MMHPTDEKASGEEYSFHLLGRGRAESRAQEELSLSRDRRGMRENGKMRRR
jgi:hypothetical protein